MRREKPLGRSRAEIASGTERALHANCIRGGKKISEGERKVFLFVFDLKECRVGGGEFIKEVV